MTVVDEAREGLRERKKAKTRRALEDAALDLFARQGFDGTTVEQIAGACDVSPRTFFRYFATKEDVLFGDPAEKRALLVDALEGRPADEPPLRSMRAAMLDLVELFEDERERRKARADIVAATPALRARGSERQDDWNDAAVELLVRRRDRRGTEPTFDVRLAVLASSAAVRAAMQTWLGDATTNLRDLVEQAFERLATGLDG